MRNQLPVVDQDTEKLLEQIQVFALDMDGTIYLGNQWIEGAKEFLQKVEESGRQYVFLTNNSSKNAKVYVEKLHKMGLDVGVDKIVTSGQATIDYVLQHFPGKKVFLLGNEMLREEFEEAGIEIVEKGAELVVTGFDTTLNYEKMCRVCDYVRDGLPYISTHPDYNCPTETGFIPDSGAIAAFIQASSFRMPDQVIGKPNREIMDYLVKRTGATHESTVMVGDRLYTDVAAGVKNGMHGILVLSGEATMQDARESEVIPDLIFTSVKHMIPLL